MSKQVELQKPHNWQKFQHGLWTKHFWKACLPFFVGQRAQLVHRVRFAGTFFNRGMIAHSSVQYWCGNFSSLSHATELTADPPNDRLLCELCEAKAVRAGEKPADELAGRHVHKGKLIARRSCCAEREQN